MDINSPFDLPDHGAHTDDPGLGHDDDLHMVSAVSPGATNPHDHLWVSEGDRIWDLGPAQVDTDNDGIADSLTQMGAHGGMTVYTDTDHDGQVDAITEVHSDGAYESRHLDTHTGQWQRTSTGRLD